MPRKLIYAPRAREDLDAIRAWLTQPGAGPVARRRLSAITRAIGKLRQNPCLFPVGNHAGVRELPCDGGYRALYRLSPDIGYNETAGEVQVLRVFGPGQNRSSP